VPGTLGARDRESLGCEGDLPFRPLLGDASLALLPLEAGTYVATCIETHNGHTLGETVLSSRGQPVDLGLPPFRHDIAIAIRPAAAVADR
jgi:hypothetical protein